MGEAAILAVDAGTTGTRASVVTDDAQVAAHAYCRLSTSYPKPGWVEQEPELIWQSTLQVIQEAAGRAREEGLRLLGLAISNQRETVVAWDAQSSKPIHPAIVWQCRRTAPFCERLKAEGVEPLVRERTGLPLDPYFSATKMAWILDNVEGARGKAKKGLVRLGTVDSWLIWKLSGGNAHLTDVTNASRTQLLSLQTCLWDEEMARLFCVPLPCLPEVCPSAGSMATVQGVEGLPDGLPILAVAGDSQAALFGEAAFQAGMAKVTYGTGSSILVNAGDKVPPPGDALAATVAWQVGEEVTYALEGIIHSTGAAVEWLQEGLGLIEDPAETEELARRVEDTGGVFFVPAFVGLGTPWWDAGARALFIGITRGTRREHLVRAVLDSIALQVYDVFASVDEQVPPGEGESTVYAGGGASRNGYLMQLQADLLQRPVVTSTNPEASSMGVAYMAGLACGLWSWDDLRRFHGRAVSEIFRPQVGSEEMRQMIRSWHRAVKRSLAWAGEV